MTKGSEKGSLRLDLSHLTHYWHFNSKTEVYDIIIGFFFFYLFMKIFLRHVHLFFCTFPLSASEMWWSSMFCSWFVSFSPSMRLPWNESFIHLSFIPEVFFNCHYMPGNVLGSGEMVCSHNVYNRVEDIAVKNDYTNKYLITIVKNVKKEKCRPLWERAQNT